MSNSKRTGMFNVIKKWVKLPVSYVVLVSIIYLIVSMWLWHVGKDANYLTVVQIVWIALLLLILSVQTILKK